MSVVYEPRTFHGDIYPAVGEHEPTELDRFPDPDVSDVADLAAVAENTYNHPPPTFDPEPVNLEIPVPPNVNHTHVATSACKVESPPSNTTTPPSARVKAIPKPEREVTKNPEGKYCCTWPECTEEVKEFHRKCEWGKHMDKHERPYRCTVEGCEKLPGFTYSGGLLRHEREVHGKHGGPKNPLHCPHPNCKRHTGKGFSRQENLAEHLRRVHTGNNNNNNASGAEETDDAASEAAVGVAAATTTNKRKRDVDDLNGDFDAREEIKRLRQENQDLRAQVEAQSNALEDQNQKLVMMMSKVDQLSEAMGQSMAPPAPML